MNMKGVPSLQTRGKSNEHHRHLDQRDYPDPQPRSTHEDGDVSGQRFDSNSAQTLSLPGKQPMAVDV